MLLYLIRTLSPLCKLALISGVVLYFTTIFLFNDPNCSLTNPPIFSSNDPNPTNLSHLVFGLIGSEQAWHHRKPYIESWWRPNVTRGYLFLDVEPEGDLLPWPESSPLYKVSENITKLIQETNHVAPVMARMVHGIMEVFREEHDNQDLRWLVMGDDDSLFFVENIVDVLAKYDHTKYYYFGGQSEYLLSNYWYSFNQAFGGAGIIMSYPLAKALAEDMESCLRRYSFLRSADHITMACLVDLGVSFSPFKGIHQIDLQGDISGLLSSHPKEPLMSLHHFDNIVPIFPSLDPFESSKHLMNASFFDQSRMLQQTICYHRPSNWSFSVSWGYSVHIYEKVMPRSYLQYPMETFGPWNNKLKEPPYYMFNTRTPSKDDPCENPHVFFLHSIGLTWTKKEVWAIYTRSSERRLPPCSIGSGNHSADHITEIQVNSPRTKRTQMDRCECCDVIHTAGSREAKIKLRECLTNERIA